MYVPFTLILAFKTILVRTVADGGEIPVEADNLGFMLLHPAASATRIHVRKVAASAAASGDAPAVSLSRPIG